MVLVPLLDRVSFGCSSTVNGFVLSCVHCQVVILDLYFMCPLSSSHHENVWPSGLASCEITAPCPWVPCCSGVHFDWPLLARCPPHHPLDISTHATASLNLAIYLTLLFQTLSFMVTPKLFLSILCWQTYIIFLSLLDWYHIWTPWSAVRSTQPSGTSFFAAVVGTLLPLYETCQKI